jgi:LPXTG-motif cell wall-anchored protein
MEHMIKRIVLLTSVLVLMLVGPATAQTGGPSGTNTCSIDEAKATVSCTVSGYQPGTEVSFTIASTPTLLGKSIANAAGVATITAPLPGDIGAGPHSITSSGIGMNGQPLVLTTQTPVSQVAADNAARNAGLTLPRTGSDSSGLIKVGVLLLALGGGAVLISRKRRAQPSS